MIATDIYEPGDWHDLFLMAGGGAAALAGLVFVAMSINLDAVARNATHRLRGINMLVGFTSVLVICGFALMGGQSHRAVGAEWFVIATAAAGSYLRNYALAARRGGTKAEMRPDRLAVGVTCYLAEIVGAAVLFFGHSAGLYVAAIGLIGLLAFMISGAWLLLVAVHEDKTRE